MENTFLLYNSVFVCLSIQVKFFTLEILFVNISSWNCTDSVINYAQFVEEKIEQF